MKKLMNKKVLVLILVIVVTFINSLLAKYIHPSVQLPEEVAQEVVDYVLPEEKIITIDDISYPVTHIVDGDTIDVEINGEIKRVRYIGIDTPESVKPDQLVECFGKEATERNRQLVEGKKVKLVKDISEVDKYNRLLRYVYVDGEFINQTLVEEGYARTVTFPPDVSKVDVFLEVEKQAQLAKRGLWGSVCDGN